MIASLPWIFALNFVQDDSLIASSSDGSVGLYERSVRGPEGGGEITFVLRRSGAAERIFTISRNFSPGDGSRPQRVSVAACRRALAQLRKAAQSLPIRVDASACTRPDRNGAVQPLR